MMTSKKIQLQIGDVVKINLGKGTYCFGRVLYEPLMVFYDMKTDTVPDIEDIISSPILFKIWVMNHAVTSGHWEIIGSRPLEPDLEIAPKFFKQDPINKEFCLYYDGKEIPATREECEGLERAAVWEPSHVEDRLRDYYAGIPNQWVESLKPK